MKGIDNIIAEAKIAIEDSKAIKIGQKVSNFTLPDPQGNSITLTSLLEKGPVVVTFYRGSWCPYCNLQLKALQSKIADIHMLGAELIAISPQVPDGSLSTNEINEMDFIVLSDQDAKVASQYGVTWKVPDFIAEHMKKDRGLDLESINNGNESILPIPATFVIKKDGIVVWRFVDVDYRTRSEPDDIIQALKKI